MPAAGTASAAADHHSSPKRRQLGDDGDDDDDVSRVSHEQLLPGLPDDVSRLCLSRLHPSLLYSVCRSWRRLSYSPSFPPSLSLYALLVERHESLLHDDGSSFIHFFCFDPISSKWAPLPPPPANPPLRPLLRHPSFLSRNFPVQTLTLAASHLVILAATSPSFLPALPRPLLFSPSTSLWSSAPPLLPPRRWCAAGSSSSSLVVASGIASTFSSRVARSVQKWDLNTSPENPKSTSSAWKKMSSLRDSKFTRDPIDAVGWRGKLCVVNVKGDSAERGELYDLVSDTWKEMPRGMIAGWRGPAAAMDEDVIYAVDESRASLARYDPAADCWKELLVCDKLRGAEQICAGGGRVCVVSDGGDESGASIVVVDVMSTPPRVWTVDPPSGFQAIAVHVLPRFSTWQEDHHG